MQSTPLGLFALCVFFVSCSSASRDVRGRDHGTVLPALRTIIDLRAGLAEEPSHPIMELELDLAGAYGDLHNGGVVTGEYQLIEGGAAMRLGRQVRDRIRFAGIMGIGVNRIDLIDRSGLPFIDDNQTEIGVRLGFELRLRFVDWLWWHGRVVTFLQPFELASTQMEVGLLFGLPDTAGMLVGYKDWRYDDGSSGLAGADDVDVNVNGLFVAMEVRF